MSLAPSTCTAKSTVVGVVVFYITPFDNDIGGKSLKMKCLHHTSFALDVPASTINCVCVCVRMCGDVWRKSYTCASCSNSCFLCRFVMHHHFFLSAKPDPLNETNLWNNSSFCKYRGLWFPHPSITSVRQYLKHFVHKLCYEHLLIHFFFFSYLSRGRTALREGLRRLPGEWNPDKHIRDTIAIWNRTTGPL